MTYKVEKSDIEGFDYKVNKSIYFSVISDYNDDVVLDYYCKDLTDTEIKEILEPAINNIIRESIKK